ncbi:MAG: hypothetical protein GKR89_22600 [Candidatus Latescibacteria bacterium]|nr:hypothetical protein [Candidatus Latescibacterota bacterium]
MTVRIGPYHTVYKNPQYYCGPGPAVVVDPRDGRITVAFRRVPSWLEYGLASHWHPATELCLTHSVDGGASWSPPQVFLGGYQCPNMRRLRDGTLIHHTHRFELVTGDIFQQRRAEAGAREGNWPGLQQGTTVWRSQDDGRSWGTGVLLSGVPGLEPLHPRLGMPVAVRGNLLETSSGRLLLSAYTIDTSNSSHLFGSDDGGRSWQWSGCIADDFNETFLHETPSGILVAFMRRQSDAEFLWAARSGDGGQSWGEAEKVCRGYPACSASLATGDVLLAYGYRFEDSSGGCGVRARILDPECGGASEAPELLLREDGAVKDLGYPDAALMPDGSVLVVYYINRRVDAADDSAPRFIEACRIWP